ncbi:MULTISPECIES: hypothetical protein [unclassified Microcystis]|jgi:integrase/recombinase XerD|uniref:hypothetical protein n=1 Tax=unclassified Microcystis TaxID=2643300 RepID=UPI0022BB56A4|nr:MULTISPECIES: hypothetical protein [unclassified Microcystis]MCZ8200084.1 hypothetical protein [Microcystis sp. LE19-55.1A]MCZ8306097.1 hypothetical protein [Microcystis sp. LE19-98.1E]
MLPVILQFEVRNVGCITELSRQGTDLQTVQAVSGHPSIANLQRYIELDPDRRKNALEKIFS